MSGKTMINGVKLHYEMTGDSAEPLVLVHGSWVDHHVWDPIVPALAQDFCVVTYDRRGHSRSERPGGQGSIHQDVADLAGLIEELGLAPAHIAGNSLGGSIALRLAGERPDLVQSLAVNEPPLVNLLVDDPEMAETLQSVQARFATVAERLEAGDMEGGARLFVETIVFGPGSWSQLPPELRQTVTHNAPTFLDELCDPEALSIDLNRLSSFTGPILLTWAEAGLPFAPAVQSRVAGALPQAEKKRIAGADHAPMQSRPDAYVAILSEFLVRATSSRERAGV